MGSTRTSAASNTLVPYPGIDPPADDPARGEHLAEIKHEREMKERKERIREQEERY